MFRVVDGVLERLRYFDYVAVFVEVSSFRRYFNVFFGKLFKVCSGERERTSFEDFAVIESSGWSTHGLHV